MVGTKCSVVTPSRRIVSTRYAGSRCPPGRAITIRAPASSGGKSSRAEASKLTGVFCSTTSPGPSGHASPIHPMTFASARCSTITPLGRPVEPEV